MISDIQNQKFEKRMMQRFAPVLAVCFFITAILVGIFAIICFCTDISSTKKGMLLAYMLAISSIKCLIASMIVKKAPDYAIYLLPLLMFACALKIALMCASGDSYSINEIVIFIIACAFNWTIN